MFGGGVYWDWAMLGMRKNNQKMEELKDTRLQSKINDVSSTTGISFPLPNCPIHES